ncbi:MAG: alpha/beta hydrolase [Parvibaculum sp.]
MIVPVVRVDDDPFPRGGEASWLARPDGAMLRVMTWASTHAKAPCRGTVVLATGRTEFIEKYFEVIDLLLQRGFAVATFDWRGQGLSSRMLEDPRKGHIDAFKTFDDDFSAFLNEVVKPNCPKPYIALGHSMGGNLMFRAAHNHGDEFAGVVLSAPMLGLNLGSPLMEKITRALVNVMGMVGLQDSYVPGSGPAAADEEAFEQNVVTSDRERFARQQRVIAKAPSIGLGGPTVGWVAASFRAIEEMNMPDYLSRITVPVLACAAGADKLVKNEAVGDLVERLPNGQCLTIPCSQHEILMEQEDYRFAFWSAFDQFVERVLPPQEAFALSDA